MTDLREAASGLLNAVESAIQSGDWKVDGACDPDSAIIALRQALTKEIRMTDLRKAAEQAYEVPLHELLDGVPENARLVIDSEDGMSTRFIPVGHLCKRAAIALRQALAQPEQEQKTPLKVLNLTMFTENRLRNGRVYDVETLQAMTNRDILAVPDMGKKALAEVLEALNVYAIQTKQEKNHG